MIKKSIVILLLTGFCLAAVAQSDTDWQSEYDQVERYRRTTKLVSKDGLYGITDIKGNLQVPLEYQEIKEDSWGTAPAKRDLKWGLINIKNGEVIADFDYDQIERVIRHKAIVYKDGLYGILSSKNELLLPIEYKFVKDIDYDFYTFGRNDSVGVLYGNKILLPMEYSKVEMIERYDIVISLDPPKPKAKQDGEVVEMEIEMPNEALLYAYKGEQVEIHMRHEFLAKFDQLGPFEKDVAKAELDGKQVYINRMGKVLGDVD